MTTKLPSAIRRTINRLAHERALIFERAERARLLLMAEAGKLPDTPPAEFGERSLKLTQKEGE